MRGGLPSGLGGSNAARGGYPDWLPSRRRSERRGPVLRHEVVNKRLRQSLSLLAPCLVALVLLPAGAAAASRPHRARAATNPPPSVAVAASRGIQELVGSGDHSPAGWNPKTGLWGASTGDFWWQSALAISDDRPLRRADSEHRAGISARAPPDLQTQCLRRAVAVRRTRTWTTPRGGGSPGWPPRSTS